MKIKINIRSIMFFIIITLVSLLFINISFAANKGKIIVDTAKLREEPNTDSKVLELISIGEEVEIIEQEEDWYKVQYKKMAGYIRSDLIEMENEENKNETNQSNTTEQLETENKTQNESENEVTENQEQENTTENTTVETNTTPTEEKSIEKGKYKISENVKLKIIPLISAIELNEINKDAEVEVTEILNDWVKVKTAEGKEGWIRKNKLVQNQDNSQEVSNTEENKETPTQPVSAEPTQPTETTSQNQTTNTTNTTKTMYVNAQTVNVRQKADKTSKVIKQLAVNTQVTVLSTSNGWAYVDISGTKGYIAENLLSSTKQQTSRSSTTTRETTNTNTASSTENKTTTTTQNTPVTTTAPASSTGSSVVSYAQQFIGCKYVYGGTSPSGFDCSGFTQYVYKHFGVNLNRTAAAQYSNGSSVTSLQAGDLVMFGKSGINHVGIYIGGNSFVHAANKQQGVRIDTLSTGYYKTNYVGARRIF